MTTPYFKLSLCAPLKYKKIENNEDFCINLSKNDDFIQCYNITPQQSSDIEPDRDNFLESLVFTGHRSEEKNDQDTTGEGNTPAQEITLPQGQYLLVQQRSAQPKNRSEWLDMAIEQQKDGLWERNKLGSLLYVRHLFEDGKFVTQVFRQVI